MSQKEHEIVITPTADSDMISILEYLSNFYPSTGRHSLNAIIDHIRKLSQFPYQNPRFTTIELEEKYRKMVVGNYIVLYRVNDTKRLVIIERVLNVRIPLTQ